mmetsp:Transcript_84701/g.224954  ORF Transcript_84701/g.224954 Transcript_84701/m.224954 type:complete len:254 (+) Transcript_84701:762-1523(+)
MHGQCPVHVAPDAALLIAAALWCRSADVGECALHDHVDVEGNVIPLVDDLSGVERMPMDGQGQQQGQARGQHGHLPAHREVLVLEEVAAKEGPGQRAQQPPRHVLANDQLLHLLAVILMVDPTSRVVPDPLHHRLFRSIVKFGVFGKRLNQLHPLVHKGRGLVRTCDGCYDLADNDAVNHRADHHGEADIDNLTCGDCRHVPEADGGEDRENKVEGVAPLHHRLRCQQGDLASGVNAPPADPSLCRILSQRST